MQFDAGETPFYVYDLFKRQIERSEVYYTLNNTHSFSQAFFANATYSYKGKYVANGTYRYEGSNQWDVVNKPVGCLLGTFGILERSRRKVVRQT